MQQLAGSVAGFLERPSDPLKLRSALGSYATGVTVITATADGERAGVTVNSFASVSLDPPLVLWSLALTSGSLGIFERATHFAVNVLGEGHEDLAYQFTRKGIDRFAGVPLVEGIGAAPVLADAVASFQCRRAHRYAGGDHVIYLGHVEYFGHEPDRRPLLFHAGRMARIHDKAS
jgi:flavin reductase (DIM6/NTAB) family NADH-FMN oxidoreductase RutF